MCGRTSNRMCSVTGEISDGSEWLALEAPYRAHDAAIVPIKITALKPQDDGRYIKIDHPDHRPEPGAGRGGIPSGARKRSRFRVDPRPGQRL